MRPVPSTVPHRRSVGLFVCPTPGTESRRAGAGEPEPESRSRRAGAGEPGPESRGAGAGEPGPGSGSSYAHGSAPRSPACRSHRARARANKRANKQPNDHRLNKDTGTGGSSSARRSSHSIRTVVCVVRRPRTWITWCHGGPAALTTGPTSSRSATVATHGRRRGGT